MKDALAAVLAELQRLRREGVTAVSVSPEALEGLRVAMQGRADAGPAQDAGAPTPALTGAAPRRVSLQAGPVAAARPSGSGAGEAGEVSGANAAQAFRQLLAAVEKPAPGRALGAARPPVAAAPGVGAAGGLAPPVFQLPEGSKRERWEWLRQRVLGCPVCRAHVHGSFQVVFGVGNLDADIFFCGEAPGGDEEVQGEPFVGPAGQLLNKMISAMGLRREDVYIGNILNWRPEMEGRLKGISVQQTGNRPPTIDEMKFGLPYLRAQVEVVQPKVIVALGSTAAEGLLGFGSFKSLGEVRGRWLSFGSTPLMVTYHPSYLLRNASNRTKRLVWEDLLKVMERVGLPISEKQRGYFLG